jgi:hypothetical protein
MALRLALISVLVFSALAGGEEKSLTIEWSEKDNLNEIVAKFLEENDMLTAAGVHHPDWKSAVHYLDGSVDDAEKHGDPANWPITVKFTNTSSSSSLSDAIDSVKTMAASMNIGSYADFVNFQAQTVRTAVDTVKNVTTPGNVKMFIIGVLSFAGVFHVIPGPLLKMQSEMMGIPQWFIFCAGLLMIGTAAIYHFVNDYYGVIALSVCMGGAGATAALMPKLLDRPGGMIFSSLTLLGGFWSYHATHIEAADIPLWKLQVVQFCAAGYVFGVLGRLFVPKLLKKKEPASTDTPKTEVKEPEVKKPQVGAASAPSSTSTPKASSPSAKSRVSSPGAKKASKKS